MNTLREINFSKRSIKIDEEYFYVVDKEGNVIIKLMLDDIKVVLGFIMCALNKEKKN